MIPTDPSGTQMLGGQGAQQGALNPHAAMALIGAALIAHAQAQSQAQQAQQPGGFRADGPRHRPPMPPMGGYANMGFHPRPGGGQFPPLSPMPGAFQFRARPGGGYTP